MEKAYKRITVGMILAAIACTAFFWHSFLLTADRPDTPTTKQSWYYYNQAEEKITISLPCKVQAGERLELFCAEADELSAGNVIATQAAVYDLEMYAGDLLLYQFLDNGREINGAVRGNIVCIGMLKEDRSIKDIHLVYHSPSGKYELSEVTVSSERALLADVLSKSLFCLLVAIAMVVIGLFALLLWAAMKQQNDNRIFCIGIFLLFCGLWCLSDSAFVHSKRQTMRLTIK